jgi:hypothetical protein
MRGMKKVFVIPLTVSITLVAVGIVLADEKFKD